MKELLPNFSAGFMPESPPAEMRQTLLYDNDRYTAYTEDLEFMWHWTIYRDKRLIQEGCSLTLESSREAVKHVLAFFNLKNRNE